jgi:hypothetical protein
MAKLTIISSCCGTRLRRDGCNGPLVLAKEDDSPCCCEKKCDCDCNSPSCLFYDGATMCYPREFAGTDVHWDVNVVGGVRQTIFWDGYEAHPGAGPYWHGVGSELNWIGNPSVRRRFVITHPTCTAGDGGASPTWTIGEDWILLVQSQYVLATVQARVYSKTYRVRPTIEIGEDGCPKIVIGDFELVSSIGVDDWNDTFFFPPYNTTVSWRPAFEPEANVLARVAPPTYLRTRLIFSCTGNPPL